MDGAAGVAIEIDAIAVGFMGEDDLILIYLCLIGGDVIAAFGMENYGIALTAGCACAAVNDCERNGHHGSPLRVYQDCFHRHRFEHQHPRMCRTMCYLR